MSMRGTVLWYDGARHVFNQIGTQRGEGATSICVNLIDSRPEHWPSDFALGVRETCEVIIDNPGMLEIPKKSVKKR